MSATLTIIIRGMLSGAEGEAWDGDDGAQKKIECHFGVPTDSRTIIKRRSIHRRWNHNAQPQFVVIFYRMGHSQSGLTLRRSPK